MRLLSKISLLLLIAAFAFSAAAYADVDKDKEKGKQTDGQQQFIRSSSASKGACSTGSATVDLDQNNVRARLYNNGHLFWRGSGNVYTVPKGGKANAVFASGIWIGGLVDNELRFAGTAYGPFEYFPGPLDENGNPPADCTPYDRIYSVTKEDIQNYEAGQPYSSDLDDWPWQLGAPVVDGDGNPNNYNLAGGDRPEIIGEQTAWWVMNDAAGSKEWSKTAAIGLEVQVTAFAFRTADALNNTTFYKYKLIHKGSETLRDTYFGIWSDPDLGNAGDDFVGSDTTLGMGFVYNGGDFDAGSDGYGSNPPALGYDFFQGPLVNNDGLDNDRDGEVDEDDERIQMSRFVYYNNDSSVQGNPSGSSDDPYNYLRGIWRDGSPMTVGGTGIGGDTPTNYMFPGDPVTQSFWSEENTDGSGSRNTPSDRRFLMSSGPFTMNPGDVQEIVYGIVWSQAGDRLASVAKMKADDALAQAAFNVDFQLPSPPDAPRVEASSFDQTVVLKWSYRPSDNNFVDSYSVLNPFLADVPDDVAPDKTYDFEGYNIYRYNSPDDPNGTLIATYDVVNEVTIVTDTDFDADTGVPITVVTARGSDSGVRHSITLENLTNYTEYYFGVQAYAYNEFSAPKVLRGPITRVEVTPTAVDARAGGTVLAEEAVDAARGTARDTLAKAGVGDGVVTAKVVDPTAITGHNYEVRFIQVVDNSDPEHPRNVTTYNIVDATTGEVKLSGQEFFNRTSQALPQRDNVAVVDGIEFSVNGPPPGIKRFETVANAAGPLNPPDMGAFAFNNNGFPSLDGAEPHCTDDTVPGPNCNDRPTLAQQVGDGRWGINVGGGDGTFAVYMDRSILQRGGNIDELGAYDYEWRFTGTSIAYRGFEDGATFEVPFELWNTGVGTPDDPSDDYRMIPVICEAACGGGAEDMVFDFGGDHPVSGADNDPLSDWVYWYNPADKTPGESGYLAYENGGDVDLSQIDHEVLARQVIVGFNAGAAPPYPQDRPEDGTVFRITTNKPNQPGDVFTLNTGTLSPTTNDAVTAEAALDLIGIVPNPYKGASLYEVDVTTDQVKFTNLPDQARIRVFTLSGTLIWDQMRGRDNNTWDLKTAEGLPLASGMYLVHVEVPGVGEKVIKFGCIKKRIQLDLL